MGGPLLDETYSPDIPEPGINDHLWEGRYSPIINGQRMARNVYAKTEAECETKLAELIREIKEEIAAAKEHRKPDNLAG